MCRFCAVSFAPGLGAARPSFLFFLCLCLDHDRAKSCPDRCSRETSPAAQSRLAQVRGLLGPAKGESRGNQHCNIFHFVRPCNKSPLAWAPQTNRETLPAGNALFLYLYLPFSFRLSDSITCSGRPGRRISIDGAARERLSLKLACPFHSITGQKTGIACHHPLASCQTPQCPLVASWTRACSTGARCAIRLQGW